VDRLVVLAASARFGAGVAREPVAWPARVGEAVDSA
jgi:hypothetical protein